MKPFYVLLSMLVLIQLNTLAQPKKNLLLIITDQQRYDALSIAGNTVLETPNLDRLGRQGAYFENAYSACAVCAPARSSILTGYTVENTGMRRNDRAYYYNEEVVMTMPTFDEILNEKGYHCEYYGKWHSQTSHTGIYRNPKQVAQNGKSVFEHGGQKYVHLDYLEKHVPVRNLKPGELYDSMTKRPYRTDSLDRHHGLTEAVLVALNEKYPQCDMHGALQIPNEHTLTAFQAKETIEAIERLKDKTFSITDDMINSPYARANGRPGLPEYAGPELINYMISNYYGLVKEIDDWVGKILEKLDELGLTDHTLVIFTSDHGEMLGAHGMREKNVFYEDSSHIPLLIRFPGEIENNTRVEGYVSQVDLFATIMDYLKIGEYRSDGKSLRGLLEGTDNKHGQYVVTEWNYRGDVAPNYMIVKGGWKLMIPYSKSSAVINAMYNLNKDPYEMNNLLGKNPEKELYGDKAEELRRCLLEWLNKNGSKHHQGVKERELIRHFGVKIRSELKT